MRRLVEQYGRDIAVQSARVGGLLRDIVGQYRLEISLVLAASEEGIAAELRDESGSSGVPGRTNQLARRLESNRGISAENAGWAVETWAYALAAEEKDIDTVEPPAEAVPTPAATKGGEAPPAPPPPPVAPVQETASAPVAEAAVAPATSPPVPESRPPRRRAAVVAAVVAALVLVGGIGFALTRGGGEESGATNTTGPTPGGGSITTPPPTPGGPAQVVLNAPGHLQVTHGPPSLNPYVKITWKTPANGDKPTRYAIYRGNESDPVKQTSKHSWVDHDVDWGTSYTYRVRSLLGANQSNATTKAVSVPDPPLSQAQLVGTASTHVQVASGPGLSHQATWSFNGSSWSSHHVHTRGNLSFSGSLKPSAGGYTGVAHGYFYLGCDQPNGTFKKSTSTITFHFTVTSASRVGSDWRATRFNGTIRVYSPAQSGCRAASVTYSINPGSLP